MKKKNIVKNNEEFSRIIKNNRALTSECFHIYLQKTDDLSYQFGISVGKKLGTAPIRNKTKRQIKSIIDSFKLDKGFKCIIIVRKNYLNYDYNILKNKLLEEFKKIDIILEE